MQPNNEKYWKDTLLCDYEKVMALAEEIKLEEFKKNKKYSKRVLSIFLNDLASPRDSLIERLFTDKDKLKEFLLLEEFTDGTFQDIVGKIMELYLTEAQLDEVTKKGAKESRDYSKYDKFAGIIYLYKKDPEILLKIQLLKKVNIRSQLKYEIEFDDFEEFKSRINNREDLERDLELFDKNIRDNKKSKFIGSFEIGDDIYIYFIREYKRSMALKIDAPRFDTVCEWIIFRIPYESNQVRVSYESKIDIKKFIPTIIKGWDEERIIKEIDIIKEFEELNSKRNVKNFLENIVEEKSCPLVEIRIDPAPFREAPVFTISDKKNKSLKSIIEWFKKNRKDLFEDINTIVECKIYFNKHRLKLKFEHKEEGITIRYLDSTIPIDLRNKFEQYMLDKFNLYISPGF
ncbi:MAG: hypothetical protein ACTSVV_05415 [Promethearchaeota archaeon]